MGGGTTRQLPYIPALKYIMGGGGVDFFKRSPHRLWVPKSRNIVYFEYSGRADFFAYAQIFFYRGRLSPMAAIQGQNGPKWAKMDQNRRKIVFFAFFRRFAHLPRSTECHSRLKLSLGARMVVPKVVSRRATKIIPVFTP